MAGRALTPAALLVLAFLEFFPRPVCTFALPQGVVIGGLSCPRGDLGNDSGFFHDGRGLQRCVRRFRV